MPLFKNFASKIEAIAAKGDVVLSCLTVGIDGSGVFAGELFRSGFIMILPDESNRDLYQGLLRRDGLGIYSFCPV